MAKILYISLNGMTEALGESQVVQYLLELAKNNEIYLLSFEKPADKDKFSGMKKRLQDVNIQWKYFEYSNRFGMFSTFTQILAAFFVSAKWVRKEKIQVVHARSIIPAVIGMLLKKIFKVKLLFDIRGFAIDEKVMEGRLKEPSLLTSLLKKLELALYRNSDHVVTLTHVSKPIIQDNYYVKPENISVIPTCANLNLFQAIPTAEKLALKEKMGYAQNDIIILRNGSLNGSYDLDAEFKLFAQLMHLDANIKFLFLNKGQHALIESNVDNYKIEKKKCKILAVDFHQISHYINIADLCVFFVKPSYAKQASAPTKFAEIVACHLYSVTNTQYGDMEYYFNLHNVGILLDLAEVHSEPKKAAEHVIEFLKKSRNTQGYCQDFDDLFAKHFSKQIAVEKYQCIYSDLI